MQLRKETPIDEAECAFPVNASAGDPLRLLGMANGDPRSPRTASGVASRLFGAMERQGYLVGAISSLPTALADTMVRARAFAPTKSAWRSNYRLSMDLARAFESAAVRRLHALGSTDYNAFFQLGAYCNIAREIRTPRFSYHDNDVLTMVRSDPRMRRTVAASAHVRRRAAYEKSVFDTVERVFTFSEWCADLIAQNYSIERSRIESVGAGSNIAPDLLSGTRDYAAAHAVFVGLDFERKGGRNVIEAFARVRKQLPGARLTLVGGAPRGDLGPGITSLGIVHGQAALAEVLRSASLFVMPSVWEPFGIVFLEAMAAGLPCIGANVCAMPEIIGNAGAVVPPNDSAALARAMYEILSDPPAGAERGRAARARYHTRYGWDKVATRIGNAIERTLHAKQA